MGHDLRSAAAFGWPRSPAELEREQRRLSGLSPPLSQPAAGAIVAGCFICFARGAPGPGAPGGPAWAAAVAMAGPSIVARAVVAGRAGAEYRPGQLASREGPLLERVVRALQVRPDVLLV